MDFLILLFSFGSIFISYTHVSLLMHHCCRDVWNLYLYVIYPLPYPFELNRLDYLMYVSFCAYPHCYLIRTLWFLVLITLICDLTLLLWTFIFEIYIFGNSYTHVCYIMPYWFWVIWSLSLVYMIYPKPYLFELNIFGLNHV